MAEGPLCCEQDEANFDAIGSDTIGGGGGDFGNTSFGSGGVQALGNANPSGGFGNTSFGNTGGGGGFGSDSMKPLGNTGGALGNTAFGSGGASAAVPVAAQAKRLDPKDFTFQKLKGETKVKEPGCAAAFRAL
jgi:hypothetical protein